MPFTVFMLLSSYIFSDVSEQGFTDNYLKLIVYYEDLNLQAYQERPAMTVGVN